MISFISFGWRIFELTFYDNPNGYIVIYSEEVDNELTISLTQHRVT